MITVITKYINIKKMIQMIDYAIEKLTELYIQQTFKDKQKGKDTYVKKSRAYKDLIDLLKEMK